MYLLLRPLWNSLTLFFQLAKNWKAFVCFGVTFLNGLHYTVWLKTLPIVSILSVLLEWYKLHYNNIKYIMRGFRSNWNCIRSISIKFCKEFKSHHKMCIQHIYCIFSACTSKILSPWKENIFFRLICKM